MIAWQGLRLDGIDDAIRFSVGGETYTWSLSFWMKWHGGELNERSYVVSGRDGCAASGHVATRSFAT